ncbi:MAG TPA: tetraacyldisaccharide 4'-kinase [Holophagaceae bacterium]|jgi:tetraacyldisaccharide 4'-kinase|nr:tetraacyldisaccharide 4'-kinase [Holophagaceae bacterium]
MSILRYLAAPLAPFYAMAVAKRNRAFDEGRARVERADLPVVSLGNLSTGGTGKTPVTLFLAQGLLAAGLETAILSRGHGGRRRKDPLPVEPGTDPAACGDEPALMARRLGGGRVFVGRKRAEAARLAHAERPELQVLLMDDGFQHRALHRDLDLLLLDGDRRWGDGRLLPLGDLREPMSHARRAQALIVTRAGRVKDREPIEAWWRAHGSGGPIFWLDFRLSRLRPVDPPEADPVLLPDPEARPAYAWCGLGNPEAFFSDLRAAGVPVRGAARFRDHHGPSADELEALDAEAAALGIERLVCTEKDAVKLTEDHLAALSLPLFVAEQRVNGGEELLSFVKARLKEVMSSRS